MSIFMDTGWFFSFYNKMDERHAAAADIAVRAVAGEFGAVYISDYIIDECVTLTLARTGRPDEAINMGKVMLGEGTRPLAIILRVDEAAFAFAWSLFRRYAQRGLSFTDCTSVALMKNEGIPKMASFDPHFDGIVERLQ